MNTTETFLLAMLVIYAVPWAVWRLFRTDSYAPLVVVQIIGGILLGPGVLGGLFPAAHAQVFGPDVIGALNGVAWWAVMLFVWVAGVELDLRQAWARRGETALTAGLALAVPLALGGIAAALLLQQPGWIGERGSYAQAVVGIGMACAVTALPILILFLEKLEILRTPLGQRILRYASLDDIAVWGVLAMVLLDWDRMARQGGFLLGFALASWLLRKLMPRLREADRWHVAMVWIALCGFAADWAGLHFMVGAFLSGVVFDHEWFGHEKMDRFRNVVLLALMPVFFLSTGLRTSWETGGPAVFGAAALFLASAVGGKLAATHIAGRLLGWAKGEAALVGWLLQTKALIMIIFANVLLDRGIIASDTFTALLLMAVASTMLTIPMVRGRLARSGQELIGKS